MVICLERGADVHMAQLMPLPLTISCFSKIQTGFTFLVPAHTVVLEKGPLKMRACVYLQSHINGALKKKLGAFLQATSRVPRWWIGERPPDMAASCDIYK